MNLIIEGKDVEMASETFELKDRFITEALAACAQRAELSY